MKRIYLFWAIFILSIIGLLLGDRVVARLCAAGCAAIAAAVIFGWIR